MSVQKYQDMTIDKLQSELLALRREQFNLRVQKVSGEQPKPHVFALVRKNIARVKTFLTQKQAQK